jgi:hypothetical protein
MMAALRGCTKTNLVRKLLILFLVIPCTFLSAYSQYWQQEVNYKIDVTLNDKEHTLDGWTRMEYFNHSPDTLHFIWFHIWPNAYKNDRTAFSDQLLVNGNTDFYFSDADNRGYINRLDFKVNNVTAKMEDHPQHIDIIKVVLPTALAPGQKIDISTPFHVKLPYNYSRGGHDGQTYQATQWYPKPAVYDKNGWHAMPYLDQGEFYSEFGKFDVTITVPSNYVVAATGQLQNEAEKQWLGTRSSFEWEASLQKNKNGTAIKSIYPESSTTTKTLQYIQSRVHDFAWFADKRFIVQHDTCRLPSGKIIDVYSYYTPAGKTKWEKSLQFAKDGVRHYSAHVGEYPYDIVSVVEGPESFGGGMEYPTITVISPGGDEKSLDITIAHEIGHNWFYGILASNEREHPWMDEGLNTFYDDRYHAIKYGASTLEERILLETRAIQRKDQPLSTSSEKLNQLNYSLSAYYKTAEWLRYLEKEIGTETFDRAMKEYYRRWQFRHPSPEDLEAAFEETSGRNLDEVFAYTGKTGMLPGIKRKGIQTGFVLNKKTWARYLNNPSKELLLFGPLVGFNSYDKLMPGIFITNYKLPPSKLQFFLAPMYGTGSKTFTGIGTVNYSFYPGGIFSKINMGTSAATYSIDRFIPDSGNKVFMGFHKIVPGIKFTFREKDPRSAVHRFVQFRSYLISEDGLRFFRDSIFTPGDTTIVERFGTESESRTLHQLVLVHENNRALYPFRGEVKIEQGKHFVRAAFTGNYFFNYPKEGGLDLRFFAGKFMYTGTKTISKQFATDRYHLNMTGPNGYEDYTYSDYFIGRNMFEGLASQQIMRRDGGFKVRTDLLADKVGRTDDWLISLNLSSTLPSGMNPLSMLPFKVPLKLFLDIGTHAEAWEKNAEGDRFLYDAGLQLSFFKETVHIYLPLLYSRVFKDYIQSTIEKKGRLWKTVSFTIDISHFSLRRLDRNLDF